MHDPIADGDIAAAKIGPRLLLQSRHQLEPDLAVGFVVLVHPADHRCERLDQVRAADHANELAVFDDRNTLNALSLEQRGNLGERRVLGNRYDTRRHDFPDPLAVRLGEFFGERARAGYRLDPPRPMLFSADLDTMDQVGLAEHTDQIPGSVDNRKGADVVLRQQPDRFGDIRIGTGRDDIAYHDINRPHLPPPRQNMFRNRI